MPITTGVCAPSLILNHSWQLPYELSMSFTDTEQAENGSRATLIKFCPLNKEKGTNKSDNNTLTKIKLNEPGNSSFMHSQKR